MKNLIIIVLKIIIKAIVSMIPILPIPFHLLGHKISFLINQVVKRFPINLRKLIAVKKTYNPKGMGLFLHSHTHSKKVK